MLDYSGRSAGFVFEQVMKIVDKAVKRDRSVNGWQNTDEICDALINNGFHVEKVPLYTNTLDMKSFQRLGSEKAEKVIQDLSAIDSLIVTVE